MAEAIEDLVLPGRLPSSSPAPTARPPPPRSSPGSCARPGATRAGSWGLPRDLPSTATLGGGREFVIEGDEYDTAYFDKRAKFHH